MVECELDFAAFGYAFLLNIFKDVLQVIERYLFFLSEKNIFSDG